MSERNEPLVVVNTDGTLAGIITESNLAFYNYSTDSSKGLPEKDVTMLRKGEAGGRKRFRYVMEVHAVAEDIMSRPVITIGKEDPVTVAVALMRENAVNSVVVMDGTNLVGIVNRDNIIREAAK
jgi:CBS domain-containing protein